MCKNCQKNVQAIRVLDVLLLAPFLVYAGSQQKSPYLKYGLYLAGAATFFFNGYNYLKFKKDDSRQDN